MTPKKPDLLSHPKFKKFIRTFPEGAELFRQGDQGSKMYVVLQGRVELWSEFAGHLHLAGLVEPGDFMGERAIVTRQPYTRVYTAKAGTAIAVLEMASQDLEFLRIAAPELMNELLTRIFETAARRLAEQNLLIRALRPSEAHARIIGCIGYFARVAGVTTNRGIELKLTRASILHHVDIEVDEINWTLQHLINTKVIEHLQQEVFLIKDLNALAQAAELAKRAAA